jgi:hypothetical protein
VDFLLVLVLDRVLISVINHVFSFKSGKQQQRKVSDCSHWFTYVPEEKKSCLVFYRYHVVFRSGKRLEEARKKHELYSIDFEVLLCPFPSTFDPGMPCV